MMIDRVARDPGQWIMGAGPRWPCPLRGGEPRLPFAMLARKTSGFTEGNCVKTARAPNACYYIFSDDFMMMDDPSKRLFAANPKPCSPSRPTRSPAAPQSDPSPKSTDLAARRRPK
eukprot:6408044-Prymnesium_polylepis.1